MKQTRLDIEGLAEHALAQPIPDSTRTTAHWLIANSAKVVAVPDLMAALEAMIDSGFMLCHNAGDVPEWNTGGHAYEAIARAREALAKACGSPKP